MAVEAVKTSFAARDEVADLMHYSLINKSHVLLIGTPSASNSAIVGAHLIMPNG